MLLSLMSNLSIEVFKMSLTTDKYIVIKFGTKCFIKDGEIRQELLEKRVEDVKVFMRKGIHPVLVVSGAVALGKKVLEESGYLAAEHEKRTLAYKQDCAALGQIELMNMYQKAFKDVRVAQILLTYSNLTTEKEEQNIADRVIGSSSKGYVVLVNFNDPVDASEVAHNNDLPGALLAKYLKASVYINVSNIDGLLDAQGTVIRQVSNLESVKHFCTGASKDGNGGMHAKCDAAEIVLRYGGRMIVGNVTQSLDDLHDGAKGTLFCNAERIGYKG